MSSLATNCCLCMFTPPLPPREQRVTGLIVGMLLALSVAAKPVLNHLPLPVLYGVLLLVGVYSLSNIQVTLPSHELLVTERFEFLHYCTW